MNFNLHYRLRDGKMDGYEVDFSDGSRVDFEAVDAIEALDKTLAIHEAKYLKPGLVICLPGN